jgi:hypothetical protein
MFVAGARMFPTEISINLEAVRLDMQILKNSLAKVSIMDILNSPSYRVWIEPG